MFEFALACTLLMSLAATSEPFRPHLIHQNYCETYRYSSVWNMTMGRMGMSTTESYGYYKQDMLLHHLLCDGH